MSNQDWAVVVGINNYPGLSNLNGPENDALGFYDWLTSTSGGDVPADPFKTSGNPQNSAFRPLATGHQIRMIKSSDFLPIQPGPMFAEPTEAQIYQAFNELKAISDTNKSNGNGPKVGRRLYLFFSGHGFAPSFEEAALLMANADNDALGFHINGKPWALWFLIATCFEQVVLFMDCCRDNYTAIGLNGVKFKAITGATAPDLSNLFIGFGTKWNRKSREREFKPNRWQGVFTTALLDGLKGEAADQTSKSITAESLANFLNVNLQNYLDPADLSDPAIERTPYTLYDPQNGDKLVFVANASVVGFKVEIEIPEDHSGEELIITNGLNEKVLPATAASGVVKLTLTRGIYRASLGPLKQLFEVTGSGASESGEVVSVKFI